MKRALTLIVGLLCLTWVLYSGLGLGTVKAKTVVVENNHAAKGGRTGVADGDASGEAKRPEDEGSAGARKEIQLPGSTYTLSIIDLDEKPLAGLELLLAPRREGKGDITGVVLDQQGKKIEGMYVTAWRAGSSPQEPFSPRGISGFVGRTRRVICSS